MAETNGPSGKIAGVILAGGQSRRMGGGDKALALLAGCTLLARVAARLRPQTAWLMLNANGPAERFAAFGLPVVADGTPAPMGPLAGILAGMAWAARETDAWAIVTVPADTPFLPLDFVGRLSAALPADRSIAVAWSRGEMHPVAGLFALSLMEELRTRLSTTRDRSVRSWLLESHAVRVDFPDGPGGDDPFFNINTPDDLVRAESMATVSG